MRATLSAGIARTCSPAVSSVISQSESAVESHASCASPERFLNPSTATDCRKLPPFESPPGPEEAWILVYLNAAKVTSANAAAKTALRRRPDRVYKSRKLRKCWKWLCSSCSPETILGWPTADRLTEKVAASAPSG